MINEPCQFAYGMHIIIDVMVCWVPPVIHVYVCLPYPYIYIYMHNTAVTGNLNPKVYTKPMKYQLEISVCISIDML